MSVNKLPAVKTPRPVVFVAAIFLGVFYFWFTQPAQSNTRGGKQKSSPEL